MEKAKCPICDKELMRLSRYPKAICADCGTRTLTENNVKIDFYNEDHGGGLYSLITNVKGNQHECYVDGKKCYAEEHRFGGIIIQLSQ